MKKGAISIFAILLCLQNIRWFHNELNIEKNNPSHYSYHVPKLPYTESTDDNIKDVDFSVNSIDVLKNNYPELNGEGIFIVQKEHQSFTSDLDLNGVFLSSYKESSDFSLHATKVASIMVGQGITSYQNLGVAPRAKIYSVNFDNLGPEEANYYTKNNISVINNSFGTTIEPFYGKTATEYDALCKNNSTLAFIFSSGNMGTSTSGKGIYSNIKGVANITGNYKMTKNTLTVGAVNERNEIIDLSSKGPAYDGRIKPELVAFSNDGTSGAAALVSGMVALAQQGYKMKYKELPSSSLIKALLINSAEDVGPRGIDFQTGYGSININQAVKDINENKFFEDNIENKEDKQIIINVPDNVENLKVTLVWNDVPAVENASKALVNDLDLSVSTNFKPITVWQPWVLSSYPHLDSLEKLPIRRKDNLNNIEQVTIENPKTGGYSISVQGSKIQSGKQRFSIAYRWEYANDFSWIFPVKSKKMLGNSIIPIRWKSTYKDRKGTLSFSLDKGKNWKIIESDIDISKGYYMWDAPDIFGEALLKAELNNQEFMSESFIIAPELSVSSLFFCTDSTHLNWNHSFADVEGIKYNIYQLNKKNNVWEKSVTSKDKFITLIGTNENDNFFVEPELPSGIKGIRSDVVNNFTTGVSCFYNDFSASDNNGKVDLILNLTTIKGIKSITFQKIALTGIQEIVTKDVDEFSLSYEVVDTTLNEGINNYQARINFTNGKYIYTKAVGIDIASPQNQFTLFPMPLSSGEVLIVRSPYNEDTTICVYNGLGMNVMEQSLTTGVNLLEKFMFLPNGNYYYVIKSEKSNLLQQGKMSIIP